MGQHKRQRRCAAEQHGKQWSQGANVTAERAQEQAVAAQIKCRGVRRLKQHRRQRRGRLKHHRRQRVEGNSA